MPPCILCEDRPKPPGETLVCAEAGVSTDEDIVKRREPASGMGQFKDCVVNEEILKGYKK